MEKLFYQIVIYFLTGPTAEKVVSRTEDHQCPRSDTNVMQLLNDAKL